jgi:hypothetical protein
MREAITFMRNCLQCRLGSCRGVFSTKYVLYIAKWDTYPTNMYWVAVQNHDPTPLVELRFMLKIRNPVVIFILW